MRLRGRCSSIRQITEEAEKVKSLVDEVNQGRVEQTRGIEEVAKAVLHMQSVTQFTAAGAEESAAAAQELTAQSQSLKDVVQRLTAMVGDASGGRVRQTSRTPPVSSVKLPAPVLASASKNHDEFPMD